MNFNKHLNLEGQHALLGASKFYWIDDDEDSFLKRMRSSYVTTIGTLLHDIARKHIKHSFKLAKGDKRSVLLELIDKGIPARIIDEMDFDALYSNLSTYVNDAIGYKMQPEVVLRYSDYCFGTTDAINFNESKKFLRIHDYKSGSTPAHIEQLMIYEALFCLEYKYKPGDIESELRIYQSNDVLIHNPTPDEILPIIEKMIQFDKFIREITGWED